MGVLNNRTDNAEGVLGVYYALDYGLVVDGVSDGAAAIQRAISAAANDGGGRVALPSSASVIVIGSTVKLLDNTELVVPTGCTLKLKAGANCDIIQNANQTSGNAGVRISGGGTIDGNRANQTGASNGVNLVKCDDARISVTIQNCYTDGLVLNTCKRSVLDLASNSDGRHGVYVTASAFPTGNVVAINNGQRVAGNGLTFDTASTDAAINLAATDTQGTKTQAYGVAEVAASSCDRNVVTGSLNGNATGTASLIGTSSKLLNTASVIQTTGTPTAVGTAAPGSATNAAAFDHGHAVDTAIVATLTDVQTIQHKTLDGTDSVPNAALAADVARANVLTNGGYEIWQRGTGAFTANNAYAPDRWQILLGGTSTISVTQETTTIDTQGTSALKAVYVQGTANSQIDQKVENYQQYRGQNVSFSIRVRQGAASNLRPYISDSGTKTYGTASATTGSYVTLTVTLAIGAASTGINVGADAGASDTFYLDNAMLVMGSVPCNYAPLHPQVEQDRCERYYEVQGKLAGALFFKAYGASSDSVGQYHHFNTSKAIAPTVTKVGTWSVTNANQPSADAGTVDGYRLYAAVSGASGSASFNCADATCYVTAEANP